MKFGGTSVEDACAFERVGQILRAQNAARPIVVVSAMSGFTDALLASVQMAFENNAIAALRLLETHFERHLEVARSLLLERVALTVEAEIERARREIAEVLENIALGRQPRPLAQDLVVSYGERLAAMLLTFVLLQLDFRARYVDARRCVITDGVHGYGSPVTAPTVRNSRAELLPLLTAGEIPVLGGFIAASEDGITTTMGRGGSDYTAATIGRALCAREVQIWTDVPGILTADPKIVKEARTIPRMSYEEAAALASCGAKFLHPKTVNPLIEDKIPLHIRSSRDQRAAGTIVHSETETSLHIKAITHKPATVIVQVTSPDGFRANGSSLVRLKTPRFSSPLVNLLSVSESSIVLTVDDAGLVHPICDELLRFGTVTILKQHVIVCLVGEGLRRIPGLMERIPNALNGIEVLLLAPDASNSHLIFSVDEASGGDVVRQLHDLFIRR